MAVRDSYRTVYEPEDDVTDYYAQQFGPDTPTAAPPPPPPASTSSYESVYDVFGGKDATNDLITTLKNMGLDDNAIASVFAPYQPATTPTAAVETAAVQAPAAVTTPADTSAAVVETPAAKTTDIVDDYIASIPESDMTVEALYTTILGRPSDAGGKAFWENAFGPTVDESEKADFLQAAQSELANRSVEEQAVLAPNLVATADTTQTQAAADPYTAINEAWGKGDYAATNAIIASSGLTAADIQSHYNLDDATMDWVLSQGIKTADTVTQTQPAAVDLSKAVDLNNGTFLTTTGAIVDSEGTTVKDTGSAATATLTQQILSQNLTDKWTGEGKGTAQANAADMASILASIDITDIKDFGVVPVFAPVEEIGKTYNGQQVTRIDLGDGEITNAIYQRTGQFDSDGNEIGQYVPVPKDAKLETIYGLYDGYETVTPVDSSKLKTVDGKLVTDTGQTTYGNKKTGEAVPNTYSERQTGNAFGGTFDGSGNTGYRVQFTPDGTPIFYTTYATSNDLAILMQDLGPIGQIGLALATGGLSIPQQIAAQLAVNVLSGKDIGDAIKSAAIGFAGAQIPGMDFMSDGASFIKDLGLSDAVTKTLTNSFQNAAISAGTALLSGGDIGEAMIRGAATGGVNGAVNSLLGNIEGFGNLTDNQKKMVTNAVTGVVSGKPLDQVLINSAISTAKNAVQEASKSNIGALDGLTSSGRTGDDMGGSYDVVDGLNTDQLKDSGLSNKDILDFIGLSNDDVPELAITDKEEDIPEIVITDDRPINYLPTDDDFPSTPVTYLPTDDDFPSTPVTSPTKPSVKPSTTPSVKPKSPSTAVKKPVLPEYSVQPGSQTIMSSQDPYAKIKLMEELFGTDITYKLLGIDEKAGKSLGAGDLNALLKLLGSK
jgi:hypothetical protein